MKRILSVALLGAAVAALGGCPIYPDNPDYRVCDGNSCYDCPNDYVSDRCQPWQCSADLDCPDDYYCSESGTCTSGTPVPSDDGGTVSLPPPYDASVPVSCTQPGQCPASYTCGINNQCDLGNCAVTGCAAGYVCELEDGTLQCVATAATVPDAGPPPVDGSTPDSGVSCQTNNDCASSPGALCLNGVCVPPANQCYDGTQCPPGDRCVAGACTPSCASGADGGAGSCESGYSCQEVDDASSSGVCSGNPEPCSANPTVCKTGTVCAQDHCVTSCGEGGACAANEVCIQGGCVPNQVPNFTCTVEGVQDACAAGSICLHHSCYIACNPEAGAAACQSADQFNECKAVTTGTGTYNVCGSSTNLGDQCNPTDGQSCSNAAALCIDGYCH